jgi:ATP-dependent DNA helicase UvrD/PcrA
MLDGLTTHQRQAVEHFEGPLLVLAGPGSGKTRVITHRIAALLKQGVHPNQILALTFTNKAAREMGERVDRLLGGVQVRVGTFHRFCSRLLRQFPSAVGLKENFTILDQSDQVRLVRRIMKEESLEAMVNEPSRVLGRISRARNNLINAEAFRQQFESRVGDPLAAVVYHVFPIYEQRVLHQNSVDFDDLLLHAVHLLEYDEHIRESLDDQFRFILVDEYQDTNHAQYQIVKAMSQHHPNLCATGDPDQSIYGWRGARPNNISEFKRDFSDVRIVPLDQNFRSTKSIVRCADALISNNRRPHRGRMETDNEEGETVCLTLYEDGRAEADGVADAIAAAVEAGDRIHSDFAIFFRVNALSRQFETALSQRRIPFQVASGYSFYERAEIRDLIAFLRLIENSSDSSAMERIINRPPRGIGAKTVLRLSNHATENGLTLFEAARQVRNIKGIGPRPVKQVTGFVDLITRLHEMSADCEVAPVIERLIAEIDYLSLWRESDDSVDSDRVANIHELESAARQYDESDPDADTEANSLQGFLELAGLSSEVDNVDPADGAVTLMTIHAAKGLEFTEVYLIGLESGLIPHERAVRDGDPQSFEEERRLLFVGITRAKLRLTLTQTRERTFRGARRSTISSPFVPEIESVVQRDAVRLAQPPVTAAAVDERIAAARARFEAAGAQANRPLVISGAELETNQASLASSTPDFSEGMLVRHPRYGRGVVTNVSGVTSRSTISVQFEIGDRSESFVAGLSPLQPIGLRK